MQRDRGRQVDQVRALDQVRRQQASRRTVSQPAAAQALDLPARWGNLDPQPIAAPGAIWRTCIGRPGIKQTLVVVPGQVVHRAVVVVVFWLG